MSTLAGEDQSSGLDYYEEVESYISERTGWQSGSEAALNLSEKITQNFHQLTRLDSPNPAGRVLAIEKILLALFERSHCASTYLFPWTNPNSNKIGYLIRPVFIEWLDCVQLSTVEHSQKEVLLEEAVLSLRHLIQEQTITLRSTLGRDLGHIERLYQKLRRSFPEISLPAHIYAFAANQIGISETTFKSATIRKFVRE